MNLEYSKNFKKQYKRSPSYIQEQFKEKLSILVVNKTNPALNNHRLKGDFSTCRSINITSDWRAIFEESEDGETIRFKAFGTHSQLYK